VIPTDNENLNIDEGEETNAGVGHKKDQKSMRNKYKSLPEYTKAYEFF